jgi:NAD(P)H-nitrite reductase large subunit
MARRHVLIGGGAATVAAAEVIREADDGAEIVVVGADLNGYYSRPGLAYFLTGELPRARLFPFTPEDVRRLGVAWITETATAIDPAAHRVTLESGRQLAYDRLLLATGSKAIGTRVPGAELDGVVTLDGMDDARDIVRRCGDGKVAVVVGGGITALEIVEGLRARGAHVHYFMRKDRYWSNVLSESESRIVELALRREGVEIHTFTDLAAIRGRGGKVAAVETNGGDVIPCDIVAAAVGVRPRIELAREAGLPCDRGILVDEYLRAGDPDIYAAGDIAETADASTGHRQLEVLWNAALLKGRVAGLNMATEPARTYVQDASINVTRLAGLHTTIIGTVGNGTDADLEGLSRGDSQIWSELCDKAIVEAERGDAHIRLALDAHTIAGAVVIGDQAVSYPLQEFIDKRVDVTAIKPALEARAAPVVELIDRLFADWRAGCVRRAPARPETAG